MERATQWRRDARLHPPVPAARETLVGMQAAAKAAHVVELVSSRLLTSLGSPGRRNGKCMEE